MPESMRPCCAVLLRREGLPPPCRRPRFSVSPRWLRVPSVFPLGAWQLAGCFPPGVLGRDPASRVNSARDRTRSFRWPSAGPPSSLGVFPGVVANRGPTAVSVVHDLPLLNISGLTHRESYFDMVMTVIVSVIIALVAVLVLGRCSGRFESENCDGLPGKTIADPKEPYFNFRQ